MLTEGTYPYFKGGVSTWTNDLITNLREFEFIVAAVLPTPFFKPCYNLPRNVIGLASIPLWGTELVKEFHGESIKMMIKRRLNTRDWEIKRQFTPHFRRFIREVKDGGKNPEAIAQSLYEMHLFLREHDYKRTFRSRYVWDVIRQELVKDPLFQNLSVSSVVEISRIVQHLLRALAYEYPEVDLCHSSAAAFCGIPAVLLKMEFGIPYLLTEHGIYFRERALDAVRGMEGVVEKILWMNLYRAIVGLNYHYADKILPVCRFNVDWEKEFKVPPEKIEVIYNGVDVRRFRPIQVSDDAEAKRVVVMARIDRLKDIMNIIDAMGYVVNEHNDAFCQIFGPIEDEVYYEQCLNRIRELGLENYISFMGPTDIPEVEYNRAMVVAQPSLSEGFPYTIIEAMACGKPVVATDVGGVREALGECGIVVPPRSPKLLAEGIIRLLDDPELRESMGGMARVRAVKLFPHERFIEDYRRVYVQAVSEWKLGV